METIEKINVRGTINALLVGEKPLILPRAHYVPSVIRNTAGSVTTDTGKRFTVSVGKNTITITRLS